MKSKLVVIMTFVVALTANAQEFKKFRVGVGLGFAKAAGEGASGGVLWALEPGYRINDQILANLRIESATVVRGTENDTGSDFDVAAIRSYTLSGQYFFCNKGLRPFAGMGFGLFRLAAISVVEPALGGTNYFAASESKMGLCPRLGFDAGHFTFCMTTT